MFIYVVINKCYGLTNVNIYILLWWGAVVAVIVW